MAVLTIVALSVITMLLLLPVSTATSSAVSLFNVTGKVNYCGAMATSGTVQFHYPISGTGAPGPTTYDVPIHSDGSFASPDFEYHPDWKGSLCITVGPTTTCLDTFNAKAGGTIDQGTYNIGYWLTVEGFISVDGVPANGITVTMMANGGPWTTTTASDNGDGHYSFYHQVHGEPVVISVSSGGNTARQNIAYDPYGSNSVYAISLNIATPTATPTMAPTPVSTPTSTPVSTPTSTPTMVPTPTPAPEPGSVETTTVTPVPGMNDSTGPTMKPIYATPGTSPTQPPAATPAPSMLFSGIGAICILSLVGFQAGKKH
jgi:hypothetical protein